MNSYLIPANTKNGSLILGLFKPFDLILLGTGIVLSLILLMTLSMDYTWQVFVVLFPGALCAFLVIPIPNCRRCCFII